MQGIGELPVIVLETQPCLDSSNCLTMIEQAKEAWQAGSKRLILDLQHTNSISTYGLYAIHTIVSMVYDEPLPTLDMWTSKSKNPIKATRAHYLNKRLLIRNSKPHITHALHAVGFNDYVEIIASAN